MKNKITFLCLAAFCLSTNAAEVSINANTKISEIKAQLGTPVRSLLAEKKSTDFFDSNTYTFLDAYSNNFGVVVLGIHPVSYRLSKKLDNGKNAAFFNIRSGKNDLTTDINVFGVKLGMKFKDAEQLIYKLSTFDKSMTAKNRGVEYQLTNGYRVVINSDKSNVVTDVELFLN
jgi:hypothetical protein